MINFKEIEDLSFEETEDYRIYPYAEYIVKGEQLLKILIDLKTMKDYIEKVEGYPLDMKTLDIIEEVRSNKVAYLYL